MEGESRYGEGSEKRCSNPGCEGKIYTGNDALVVQQVVMGMLRPILIDDEPLYFHNEECLRAYFCNSESQEKLPRRMP